MGCYIGLWLIHFFLWFAVIYEVPQQEEFGEMFTKKGAIIYDEVPKDFDWSVDYTKPKTIKHGQIKRRT
jgi:uncharacterized protein YktB (UPF0637 family)